jgi:hypothetical protein
VDSSPETDRHLRAVFSFDALLAPGKYSIALSFNDNRGGGASVVHDKIAGARSFTVQEGSKRFHGAVDLRAQCHIEAGAD